MAKEIRKQTTTKGKLEYIFEHADRLQDVAYKAEDHRKVLLAIISAIRSIFVVEEMPKSGWTAAFFKKIAAAGVKLVAATVFDLGASAAADYVGSGAKKAAKSISSGGVAGAKKTAKKAAKKAAKRGSAA